MNNELSNEAVKQIQLDLLKVLHCWCAENGCRYSLSFGSLIGAVRHGGYIPWDDDIDVMMPRADYEKLIAEYPDGRDGAMVCCYEKNEKYVPLFAKFSDCATTLTEDYTPDFSVGVNIDVFPIDGLGADEAQAVKSLKRLFYPRLFASISSNTEFRRGKSGTNFWKRSIKYLVYRYAHAKGNNYWHRKYQKAVRRAVRNGGAYVGCEVDGYSANEVFPASWFDRYILMPFEGENFCVIEAYDGYLRKIYGDYMQLPPETERVAHHTYHAYRKDETND